MKRHHIFLILVVVLIITLACNLAVATGSEKMTPQRWDTNGDRRSFSGEYSCEAIASVILIIDEDGVATLSTTGPVYVDYINCTLDPSGFEATYNIVGLADPDSKMITFTSCNDGGFRAEGQISYMDDKPTGNIQCWHLQGDQAGKPAISLWVPAGNP